MKRQFLSFDRSQGISRFGALFIAGLLVFIMLAVMMPTSAKYVTKGDEKTVTLTPPLTPPTMTAPKKTAAPADDKKETVKTEQPAEKQESVAETGSAVEKEETVKNQSAAKDNPTVKQQVTEDKETPNAATEDLGTGDGKPDEEAIATQGTEPESAPTETVQPTE